MSDWLHNLPVVWMGLVVFAATYLVAGLIYAAVNLLAVGERARAFRAVSPGLLSPLGVVFGLYLVFTGAQVWGDIDRANAAVNREASALSTIVILAASFPGEPEERIRALVRRYIDIAATEEWPMMARHAAKLRITPPPLGEVLQLNLSLSRVVARRPRNVRSPPRSRARSKRAVNVSRSAYRRSIGSNGCASPCRRSARHRNDAL
jgi:hypothetical protein